MSDTNTYHDELKEKFMIQLRPYEEFILKCQEILYGKHPLLLIALICIFDAVLIFAHISNMGIFSLTSLLFLIVFTIYYLNYKFSILKLVPQIAPINESNANKELHTFEEICSSLATGRQKLGMFADYLLGNQFEQGVSKIIYVLTVWFTIAFVFNIIGKFWLVFLFINICILTPGFNILFLVFGWVGTLIQAILAMFVNPQPGQPQNPVQSPGQNVAQPAQNDEPAPPAEVEEVPEAGEEEKFKTD